MEFVTIARLTRTRGIKGELAAISFSSQPERLGRVFVKGVPLVVERIWHHLGLLVFKFQGIDSISAAEPFEGADVEIPFEERAPLEAGEYYHSDLVGCEVVERLTGKPVGCVTGWREYGPTPLLEVKDADGREILVPFAKAICVEIDPAGRRIGVDLPEGLIELE